MGSIAIIYSFMLGIFVFFSFCIFLFHPSLIGQYMNDSLSFLHILSKRDALHVDADPIIGILKESICLSGMHKPHMQRHFTIHIVDKQNFQESLSNQDNSRSCNLSHFNVANPHHKRTRREVILIFHVVSVVMQSYLWIINQVDRQKKWYSRCQQYVTDYHVRTIIINLHVCYFSSMLVVAPLLPNKNERMTGNNF